MKVAWIATFIVIIALLFQIGFLFNDLKQTQNLLDEYRQELWDTQHYLRVLDFMLDTNDGNICIDTNHGFYKVSKGMLKDR